MHGPLQAGDQAPDFTLPAINGEGTVSLSDHRGRNAVVVGLFRGLHCPFCRRQLVQLSAAQPGLAAAGVQTLAVVNTPLERARVFFRYRPTSVTLLADPDCISHRAFGVPAIEFVAPGSPARWPRSTAEAFQAVRIDPTGELREPTHPMVANEVLNRKEGFELTPADEAIFATHGTQLTGHFLVDRAGIIRWSHAEAADTPADLCRFPSPDELVAAARRLQRRAS